MQEIINNCIEALKANNGIIIHYKDATFVLCDVNNDETSMIRLTQTRMKIHHASSIRPIKNKLFTDEIIKNINSNFKAILVREDIYIEDYCGGVIPIVYDLIAYSNKNLFLQLTKLKNASNHLKIDEHFAMYHVPKDSFLNHLCKKYRKAICIMQLEKEFNNSYYHVNLSSFKNPFQTKSIIRLFENGVVKVIEK
jgi:hypothetical protein